MFIVKFILALLALSFSTKQTARPPGADEETITDITLPESTTEGGEKVTPEDLGLTRVTHAECSVIHGSESAELQIGAAHYDEETEKLEAIDLKTGKIVAKEKNLSKVVVRVRAFGK